MSRRHLGEYLTGLFVAQRKTVLGIHDEFAQTTDQSCLNRFLTEVPWDVQTLNLRRLERLQEDPFTRYSDHGVIAIDNTLIDRVGQLIPDAGWFWDHAEERNKIAQGQNSGVRASFRRIPVSAEFRCQSIFSRGGRPRRRGSRTMPRRWEMTSTQSSAP